MTYRILGTDDSVNSCDCCGRTGLKFTVTIELESGEIVHYGQVCATRKDWIVGNDVVKALSDRDRAIACYWANVRVAYKAAGGKYVAHPKKAHTWVAADSELFDRIKNTTKII